MTKTLPKEYISLLTKYISFKSISTDKKFSNEIKKTHEWLISILKKEGLKTKTLRYKDTNPIVYAEYIHNKNLETILIYGHYDVQPASTKDWKYDPFKLRIVKDKLIARGSTDNKGQLSIHLYTIFKLIRNGELKYNVKFFIEGNEESGSPFVKKIIQKNKSLLKSDHIFLSDGEMINDQPTIDVAFRGGTNIKVTYRTSETDLHSGLYGGAVPNAAYEMSELLSKMYDSKNQVSIPNFYKGTQKMKKQHIKINKNNLRNAQVQKLLCEPNCDFYTQIGKRPTIQITGLDTGYTGRGFSNIIPHKACAWLNIRVAPSQKIETVLKAVISFLEKNTPKHVDLFIEYSECWNPIEIKHENELVEEIKKLLLSIYRKKTIENYVGGSLPIVGVFKEVLCQNPISISLANEDCNMHGIDENIKIENVKKGLEFSEKFFGK